MKELRGMDAVRYAESEGISFNIDENYLIEAEGNIRGRPATRDDIEKVFDETLGSSYDPANVHYGGESFDLLIKRYGDASIYVPVEGLNPKEEEKVALDLFRQPLKKKAFSSWSNILDLVKQYSPLLINTGFSPDANLNLLFHAALRLVEQEKLESIADENPLPEEESSSYGRRRFILPPDFDIDLSTLFCGRCWDECDKAYLILHYECALRLQKALAKATRLHKNLQKT